jgi:hypothetical protein
LLSLHDPIDFERSSAPVVGQPRGLAVAGAFAFWLVALFAIAGVATGAARRIPAFVWVYAGLLVASIIFVAGSARYRAPLEPIVILLAAAAVERALSSRPRWSR